MHWLLVALLALPLHQGHLPSSGGAHEVVLHTPGVGSPLEGFLTIGEFSFKRGRYAHARQVFAYGLLYAPQDIRFLSWLARTEEATGQLEVAREYARAALDVGDAWQAREVLARIERRAPVRPSPAAPSAAPPHSSPSPASSPKPPVVAARVTPELLATLAPLVGAKDPKELARIGRPGPSLDSQVAGDRLTVLGVLKAVDAALKIYTLNHPKTPLKELNFKVLIEDQALPRDFDPSKYSGLSLAGEGKVQMEGFGGIEPLETELALYRDGLDKAVREKEKGLLSEANATLKGLVGKYPTDPGLLSRLLSIEMQLALDFEGVKTAQALFRSAPEDPHHLYTLALLYFRTSRPDRARQIAVLLPRIYPSSFYGTASTALVRLIDAGVTHALLASLIAQRESEMAQPGPSLAPASASSASASPSPPITGGGRSR